MIKRKRFLTVIFIFFISFTVEGQIKFGYNAPELALPSLNGDTLRLSSLKGKVVLLDFWASWCGPCRMANKGLAKLYSKYKSKGFEILSVSLDENSNSWKKAIKKDKAIWLQVIDDRGPEAFTAMKWQITSIPTTYLIDKEGKLVAMDLEGRELEKAVKGIL
jgi:thiol-disulfide isomerase/thioredoxin